MTGAAAAEVPQNLVLVPLQANERPGAFGSIWKVTSTVWNGGERLLITSGTCNLTLCSLYLSSGEQKLTGSRTTEDPFILIPEDPAGQEQLAYSISVMNLSYPQTSEVRVPVADLSEMVSSTPLRLIDVPTKTGSRKHLRLYLIDDHDALPPDSRTVTIQVFHPTVPGAPPIRTVTVEVPMRRSILVWGTASIYDFGDYISDLGLERVRLEVTEESAAYLWGFVTITGNITNQPLVIAPE